MFPAFVVSTTKKKAPGRGEAQNGSPASNTIVEGLSLSLLKKNCQCFGSVAVAISFPAQVNDLMDACRHNHLESISNFNAFKIYKQDPQVVQRSESAHVRKAYHFFFGEDA